MITEQRKKRLKAKVQQARERLVDSHPFFGLLLMYMGFGVVPGMDRMSLNGRYVFFDPAYADKLYDHELDYMLCHGILHLICGHIWRPRDLAGMDYHYACDIIVNNLLWDMGFTDRYSHLGELSISIPGNKNAEIDEMTADEVYRRLPYSLSVFEPKLAKRFVADSDIYWNNGNYVPDSCEIILLPIDEEALLKDGKNGEASEADCEIKVKTDEKDEELKLRWKLRIGVTAALNKGRNGGEAGNIPSYLQRIISEMKTPALDWRSVLNAFVQENVCDYSFSPPDRRYADTGFFLPDFNEMELIVKQVLFMVDTSGSINSEELGAVYSELRGAIEAFNGKLCGELGFFDTMVTAPIPFESVEDLMAIVPYGGGGTDFRGIFGYIREHYANKLPSCVIIFTDGEGAYPNAEETMGIPVLWIMTKGDVVPPWGKVVRMQQNSSTKS